jgi:hypothetical protein
MSASTLHRYVNGDAVPADYAPVERFARLCRATPAELVELHRRWVLADARRGRKGTGGPAAGAAAPAVPPMGPAAVPSTPASASAEAAGAQAEAQAGATGTVPEPRVRRFGRRKAVQAAAAVVAAVLAAALVTDLLSGGGSGHRQARPRAAGSASADARPAPGSAATPSHRGTPSASPVSGTTAPASAHTPGAAPADPAAAPAVVTDPYYWNSPCEQHYLVNRAPAQVPPPPAEDDARGWVTALGGVATGEHWVRLTVQGTGKGTVVLEGLHVHVVEKDAPLAWNDYLMGYQGCGGGVRTRHFEVDLDAGRPLVTPASGQQDFPYKVSETDPEVYYVTARTQAHDVRWYLELDWSSGDRHGTVRVDDRGQPFRTSGNTGRPAYDYPLGADDRWEAATG